MSRRSNLRLILVIVAALAVLVVAGVIVLVLAGSLGSLAQVDRARVAAAETGAFVVKDAAIMHLMRTRECATLDDLVESGDVGVENAEDPWGNPYRIRCDGDRLYVTSDGRDGEAGTEDDVSARSPFR
jgi:general secretion pathway protein G